MKMVISYQRGIKNQRCGKAKREVEAPAVDEDLKSESRSSWTAQLITAEAPATTKVPTPPLFNIGVVSSA